MSVTTQLVDKNYSPLFVVTTSFKNLKILVGIISDVDADKIDVSKICLDTVHKIIKNSTVQEFRNLAGKISDRIVKSIEDTKAGCTEGVGVVVYDEVSETIVSSLYGDMMNHGMCRHEFYYLVQSILNSNSSQIYQQFLIRKYNIVKGWPLWIAVDKTAIDDNEIVKIVKEQNVGNSYTDIQHLMEALWLYLHDKATKIGLFLYVDKAWFTMIGGFTQDELNFILQLLNISPHV